jgi:hypothetical protein
MRGIARIIALGGLLLAGPALTGCPSGDDSGFDVPDFGDVRDSDGDAPTDESGAEDAPIEVPDCPTGETACGATCFDLLRDPNHCGACGTACVGADVCDNGTCSPTCGGGRLNCDGSCIDAQTDPLHCADCATICPEGLEADPVCTAGVCGLACHVGFYDFDGEPGCEYACTPTGAETCNALDDNCDGVADESFACSAGAAAECTTTCGSTGTGVCGADCTLPAADACTAPAETCNGIDDDCDTRCDNGFGCCMGATASCLSSCGAIGLRTCGADCTWGACESGVEVCNGLDDDCDTILDDDFECARRTTETCTTDCGSTGNHACSDTCVWGACTPPREICNGADDDCDTVIDNGFACIAGTTESCDAGGCPGGSRTCSSTCVWGACQPPADVCDGVDNDCDTTCDEGTACCAGTALACTNSCGVTGTQSCDASCAIVGGCCAATEICRNTCDDDCDGLVNEDCTLGDTCTDSILIPAGTTTLTGDTTTMAADYSGVCVGASGPDMVYRFTVATTRAVTFSTCGGAAFDTVLYAYAATCGSGTYIACADDSCGVQSTITFTATAGVTYYVVMDGYGTASLGPFTLTITGL